MAQEKEVTVLGRSVRVHGDISGDGDLQIDGLFEGSAHVPGARITVGADARVPATLHAQDVVVLGQVDGDVRAPGRVALRASAQVIGDVFCARFAMEADAVLRGHVDDYEAGAAEQDGPHAAQQSVLLTDGVTFQDFATTPMPKQPAAKFSFVAASAKTASPIHLSSIADAEATRPSVLPQPSWAAEPDNS